MRNPLQDQLLKAGLVKKSKMAQVVREQAKQRQGKAPPPEQPPVDAQQLQAERAERDRALAAERNAQRRAEEVRAQVRQIIDSHRVQPDGDIAYSFVDGSKIHHLWVNDALRAQLARGALVIARHDAGYALLPRAAAGRVDDLDPAAIVLDHSRPTAQHVDDMDAEYHRRFPVPDDLIW